jgi:hypothetical protein
MPDIIISLGGTSKIRKIELSSEAGFIVPIAGINVRKSQVKHKKSGFCK